MCFVCSGTSVCSCVWLFSSTWFLWDSSHYMLNFCCYIVFHCYEYFTIYPSSCWWTFRGFMGFFTVMNWDTMSFGWHMCAAHWEAYVDMKLGVHIVCICLASIDTAKEFPKVVVAIYTLTSTLRVLVALNFV